jgi:TRAP transporter TAXI family solute receptor
MSVQLPLPQYPLILAAGKGDFREDSARRILLHRNWTLDSTMAAVKINAGMNSAQKGGKKGVSQGLATFTETFGLSRVATFVAVGLMIAVVVAAISYFIESAPPRTITISTGPPNSSFERVAKQYRDILARNHVKLEILQSQGSLENLQRLSDPASKVDIGFVQTGETNDGKGEQLYSLGSVAYQPLLIFYRSPTPAGLLSDLAGKRLAVGATGSGTRALAMTLLETNGIVSGGTTTLLDLDADDAAKALATGNVDAVFLMGDSASSQTMRTLLHAPDVHLFSFAQADAYARRMPFLNKLVLPRGSIDFGKDLPAHDVTLVGPTVELIARSNLHPALSDLLLEAAREVHGKPTLLQNRNEFPAEIEHDFPISPDAVRYYKTGKKTLYKFLPFWLASLVSRMVVAFVPLVLLIPGLRLIPAAYKWRVQLRIYRWYRGLLRLERDLAGDAKKQRHGEFEQRLDHIENSVNQMKVPASFAGQFYSLREHIGFVRERLGAG